MPFKSQAQRRKFYALLAEGKISKDVVDRWEKETVGELPERVTPTVEKTALFPLLPLGIGAGIALGGYHLARRFRPSEVPELRALQENAKDKDFQVATRGNAAQRAVQSLLFGARAVDRKGARDDTKAVLWHDPSSARPRGGVDINGGQLPALLDDKWHFHQLMTKGTGGGAGLPDSVPHTLLLADALREVGGDPAKLTALMGERGYVIKPREGSLSKANELITHRTPLDDRHLQRALSRPHDHIIQEFLPIRREFRVHMVNNVPVSAAHRQLPNTPLRSLWNSLAGGGGGAFVPVTGDTRDRLLAFARESTKHLGMTPEGKSILGATENLHHGMDFAELPNGTFKAIESNPIPGTFMNPVVSNKVQQAVTGRIPRGAAAVAAGTLGIGGALLAKYIEDHNRTKTSAYQRDLPARRMEYTKDRTFDMLPPKNLLGRIRRRQIGEIGGFKIIDVDGEKIRNEIDTDFTDGGNPARYGYVPKDELWIERDGKVDQPATVAHEYKETKLMLGGMSYDKAHDKALEVERSIRDRLSKTAAAEPPLTLRHFQHGASPITRSLSKLYADRPGEARRVLQGLVDRGMRRPGYLEDRNLVESIMHQQLPGLGIKPRTPFPTYGVLGTSGDKFFDGEKHVTFPFEALQGSATFTLGDSFPALHPRGPSRNRGLAPGRVLNANKMRELLRGAGGIDALVADLQKASGGRPAYIETQLWDKPEALEGLYKHLKAGRP